MPKHSVSEPSCGNHGAQGGSSTIGEPSASAGYSSHVTGKRRRVDGQPLIFPQVLLSIRLEQDSLDIPAWKDWIRSTPAEGKDIKIEGFYGSFSTLLLVQMPVALWNLLKPGPAYSLVGYVTTENKVTEIEDLNSVKIDIPENTPSDGPNIPPTYTGGTNFGQLHDNDLEVRLFNHMLKPLANWYLLIQLFNLEIRLLL